MKNYKYLISYFLFWFFLILIFYISWLIKLLETLISLTMYLIISFLIYSLWKKFRKKEVLYFNEFAKVFIYKVCLFIYLIVIIIWSFAYYNNSINPAKMPEYTISNWEKIIVFQAMSHIAKKDFYVQIRNNIREFKSNSGVYFYEWVKPWNKESSQKFDEALWVNFTPDLYKHMSTLYGVTFQDNNDFIGLVNNLDFNVDLTLDEIIKIYEKKVPLSSSEKSKSTEIINASELILNKLNELNNRELKVLIYINQAILNTIIKNDSKAKELIKSFWNQDLFNVILDDRNKNLADTIIKSEYNKIYITYWLLHFDWMYKLLQKNNPNWKIISTRYFFPIK